MDEYDWADQERLVRTRCRGDRKADEGGAGTWERIIQSLIPTEEYRKSFRDSGQSEHF